jgi:hypothetical protein
VLCNTESLTIQAIAGLPANVLRLTPESIIQPSIINVLRAALADWCSHPVFSSSSWSHRPNIPDSFIKSKVIRRLVPVFGKTDFAAI